MTSVLTPLYLQQGDTIKAIYCLDRVYNKGNRDYMADFGFGGAAGDYLQMMSIAELENVKAFDQKKDKTPYEKWLVANTGYSVDLLNELEGTKYIAHGQFDKAIGYLKKVPADVLSKVVLPDCFTGHIIDMLDWNKADSAVTYNKLSFCQKMVSLEDKMKTDPKDAKAIYAYANGLYSITHYGKGWEAVKYFRSGNEEKAYFITDFRMKDNNAFPDYYSAESAQKYYMLAFQNSTDPELRARYLFMAAKCWQKNCPAPPSERATYYYFNGTDSLYYTNSLRNPYFKKLENFKDTKFFTIAKTSCSYLRDYLKK